MNGQGTMPTKPKRPILPPIQEGTPTMAHPFSEEEYKKGIAALKNHKAAGLRMLHMKQDPQDMDTIQDYDHTQARERLRDSEELLTNPPLMSYVQTLRTNDSKQNSPSSWTTPNQGTSRLQDREVMH